MIKNEISVSKDDIEEIQYEIKKIDNRIDSYMEIIYVEINYLKRLLWIVLFIGALLIFCT